MFAMHCTSCHRTFDAHAVYTKLTWYNCHTIDTAINKGDSMSHENALKIDLMQIAGRLYYGILKVSSTFVCWAVALPSPAITFSYDLHVYHYE